MSLAGLIAKREITAGEVLELAIARAETVNPSINAIVYKQYDEARATAANALPQGLLTGVPFLIKGLSEYQKGVPASFGSNLYRGLRGGSRQRLYRALQARRSRHHGPQSQSRTRAEPQHRARALWSLPQSLESRLFARRFVRRRRSRRQRRDSAGRARHDGRRRRIRTPSAHCGLFGLKPSRGRISFAPDSGEGWGGLAAGHVISRSVRDSAVMLDCTSGVEPGDPYAAPTPARPFADAVKATRGGCASP